MATGYIYIYIYNITCTVYIQHATTTTTTTDHEDTTHTARCSNQCNLREAGPTIHDHPTNLALTQVALILHLLTVWVCEIKVWAEALGGYDTQFGKVIYTETSSLQQLHWNQLPLAIEQQTGTDHNYILAHCPVLPVPTGDWGCWVHFHFPICIKWLLHCRPTLQTATFLALALLGTQWLWHSTLLICCCYWWLPW